MNLVARILAATYVLAIVFAGLGPHCDWMFPLAKAAPAHSATPDHSENHAGHSGAMAGHSGTMNHSGRDCAAMEMEKSIGPVSAVLAVAAPDMMLAVATPSQSPLFSAPVVVDAVQPRGPPRTGGGFAAVFASNHRLLI